jgi:hypothetical protein
MNDICRICRRPAVANLDRDSSKLPVCELHRAYFVGEMTEAATKESGDRFLGFGYAIDELRPDGTASLRCDKSTIPPHHSWTGFPGSWCYWCLSEFMSMMTDQRDIVLRDPVLDPADKYYEAECQRKVEALTRAIGVGLITKEEGLARLEKWVAHV